MKYCTCNRRRRNRRFRRRNPLHHSLSDNLPERPRRPRERPPEPIVFGTSQASWKQKRETTAPRATPRSLTDRGLPARRVPPGDITRLGELMLTPTGSLRPGSEGSCATCGRVDHDTKWCTDEDALHRLGMETGKECRHGKWIDMCFECNPDADGGKARETARLMNQLDAEPPQRLTNKQIQRRRRRLLAELEQVEKRPAPRRRPPSIPTRPRRPTPEEFDPTRRRLRRRNNPWVSREESLRFPEKYHIDEAHRYLHPEDYADASGSPVDTAEIEAVALGEAPLGPGGEIMWDIDMEMAPRHSRRARIQERRGGRVRRWDKMDRIAATNIDTARSLARSKEWFSDEGAGKIQSMGELLQAKDLRVRPSRSFRRRGGGGGEPLPERRRNRRFRGNPCGSHRRRPRRFNPEFRRNPDVWDQFVEDYEKDHGSLMKVEEPRSPSAQCPCCGRSSLRRYNPFWDKVKSAAGSLGRGALTAGRAAGRGARSGAKASKKWYDEGGREQLISAGKTTARGTGRAIGAVGRGVGKAGEFAGRKLQEAGTKPSPARRWNPCGSRHRRPNPGYFDSPFSPVYRHNPG